MAVPPVAVGEGSVGEDELGRRSDGDVERELGFAQGCHLSSLAVRMSPVPAVLIVQPLKAATPPVVVDVQPESVPVPVVRAKVMELCVGR